jgi:hypothetical protein
MVVKHLTGRLTEDGELKLDRPEELNDLKVGEVEITVKGDRKIQADEDVTWTAEELKEALSFHPVPLDQIVIEPWPDGPATEDSLADVLERRRKKREARRWQNG